MKNYLLTILLSSFSFFFLKAQFPTLTLSEYATGLNRPVEITHAGDGSNRLFIIEQNGRIRIYDQNTNTLLSTPFLDISSIVRCCGERGLLGLAFHPDYANNGRFFVNYTSRSRPGIANGTSIIAEYHNPDPSSNTVDASTESIILSFSQPFTNHNAGDLEFGPQGDLWIPTGDGGSGGDPDNYAQNPQSLLGKLLKIDVDSIPTGEAYGIPANNPYINDANVRDEIWGMGLRNPWRFAFDSTAIWIADVGQGEWEEVDYLADVTTITDGINWGWRCYEGTASFNTSGCGPIGEYTPPVFEYDHTVANGGFSITGGRVYRGSQFPDLVGHYICADYLSHNFWLLKPENGSVLASPPQRPFNGIEASAFGCDENGELYVASLANNAIYQIAGELILPVVLDAWEVEYDRFTNTAILGWTSLRENNTSHFIIEKLAPGNAEFREVGEVPAAGNSTELLFYDFIDAGLNEGSHVYRLRTITNDSQEQLSPTRTISVPNRANTAAGPQVSPNPFNDGPITVMIPADFHNGKDIELAVFNVEGKRVIQQLASPALNSNYSFTINQIGVLPTGSYTLQVKAGGQDFVTTLIRK